MTSFRQVLLWVSVVAGSCTVASTRFTTFSCAILAFTAAGGPAGPVPLRRVRKNDDWAWRRTTGSNQTLDISLGVRPYGIEIEPLLDLSNVQYLGTIQLGTPGQTVVAMFDTGSSDVWVSKSAFYPEASTSFGCPDGDCGQKVTIQYSVGAVVGELRHERISFSNVSIADQSLVFVDSIQELPGFQFAYFQAVLGLAFPSLSHGGVPLLSRMATQEHAGMFSFVISDMDAPSLFMLGQPDETYIRPGTLTYVPVFRQERWTFKGSLVIGDTIICSESEFALDTGTSYITIPRSYFDVVLSLLLTPEKRRGCGQHAITKQFACPCESMKDAQVAYVVIGNVEFPLFPEDLFHDVNGVCVLELQPSSDTKPFILGDTFLRTVAATFDINGLRIGVGQRAGHAPRLQTTRERLLNRSFPLRGPRFPPYVPVDLSWWTQLPLSWLLVAAVLLGLGAGIVGGKLLGYALDTCDGHKSESGLNYLRLEGA